MTGKIVRKVRNPHSRQQKKTHPWLRWTGNDAIEQQQKELNQLEDREHIMPAYARRVDDNHALMVKTLKSMGASVFSLARMGDGCPDLLVGIFGITTICEVKDGDKPLSAQKLTFAEQEFKNSWKGDYHIIRCVDDCVTLIHELKGRFDAHL